jgi:hypothetical protein
VQKVDNNQRQHLDVDWLSLGGGGGMESPGYVLFPHQFATRPLAERLRLMEVPCCKVGGWVGSPSG